jgi:mRNA-degrading endonuclease RelE of RelBE toxin-antitoxin system
MFRSIHLHPKFDKQLNALKRGDRKAARAAETGERLVEALTSGLSAAEGVAAPTRSGEWRVKRCRKYDLGSGYRLVTILQDRRLYVVCIGAHDECDRWLEINRDWEPAFSSKRVVAWKDGR